MKAMAISRGKSYKMQVMELFSLRHYVPSSSTLSHTLSVAGRTVIFHEVNLTAAFSSYRVRGTDYGPDGMNSFGLGYRGMCRYAAYTISQGACIGDCYSDKEPMFVLLPAG